MKNKNIRILHISTNKNGGVGSVVKELCKHFKNSFSVELYNDAIQNISIFKQYINLKNKILLLLGKVDLLHFHGSWAPHIFILVTRQCKPVLLSPHGALHRMSLKKSWLKKKIAKILYVKRTYLNANCIHALTTQEVDDLHNFGVKNVPIAVIPNGLDFDTKVEIDVKTRNKLAAIIRNRKVVLSLSRLDPLKGIDMLIEAFSKVRANNHNIVLLIVGSGSCKYKKKLETKIEDLNLSQDVYFLGEMNGACKGAVYDVADLFVLPSFNEGFGITVLEAYRQKIPVITTTATPFKELSENDIGWYVDPSTLDITKALNDALKLEKTDLIDIGERGFNFMRSQYSLNATNSKMESLYGWLVNGGKMPEFVVQKKTDS